MNLSQIKVYFEREDKTWVKFAILQAKNVLQIIDLVHFGFELFHNVYLLFQTYNAVAVPSRNKRK